MFGVKQCPFCGGYIKFVSRIEHIDLMQTEAVCTKCHMVFKYEQNFVYSKDGRVAVNNSFEEVWNSRIKNEGI